MQQHEDEGGESMVSVDIYLAYLSTIDLLLAYSTCIPVCLLVIGVALIGLMIYQYMFVYTYYMLGVVYKIDQSEARNTRVRNLDYDITARTPGRTRGRARTVTQHL